jgi:thiol:disulfide interchange protein
MELFLLIVTAVFLIASVGIAKWMQPLGMKLILLGILVAAAGCWFSLLEMETANAAHASPVMMRLSVILVLAGVGCTFMPYFTRETDAKEPAEHGAAEKDEPNETKPHEKG